jgi:type VI secretion system secreted protein VgrG
MASPYKQDRRPGELHTPLGENELVLRRLDAIEGISELFEYRVLAISHRIEPDFNRIIGRNCTVTLTDRAGEPRYFDGILTDVQLVGIEHEDFIYRMTLRPWLWLLSKRTNCLIFHEKTAPEIIDQIFKAHSDFAKVEQILEEDKYPVKEYCVQYRESDMAFVCRLMEEAGISYHFVHEKGKHTLVMGDGTAAYKPVPGSKRKFVPTDQPHWRDEEHFNIWRPERRFTSGKTTLEEYDFKKPTAELRTEKSNPGKYANGELELFDYPGKHTEQEDGKKLANWWLESEQAQDEHVFASGNCLSCAPGQRVTLTEHPNSQHNQEYLILRATHSYDGQHYRSTSADAGQGYQVTHELMTSKRPYAPPIVTPLPRINGPQTATVVGEGEIDCDEYGRILVRFHWDRADDQSMRVRVGQVWAGQKWGGIFTPRVGMEVIVDHLEGDPDQPIVIGCVYNKDNMPPYPLPNERNKSGWKSQSTANAPAGYNEIMMDDTFMDELIQVHAQKDLDTTVENDERRKVGINRKTNIGINDTLDVGVMLTVTANAQISLTVGASSIVMTPASIAITSPAITINGSAVVSVSSGAAVTITSGGAFQTSASLSAHQSAAPYTITAPIFKVTGVTILTGPPVISPV